MKRQSIKLVILMLLSLGLTGCFKGKKADVVRLAIPYSDDVQNLETNYYIRWLSEKTGLIIEPVTIQQKRCSEYLDALFASELEVDAVLFGEAFTITEEELQAYIEKDALERLEDGSFYYPDYGSCSTSKCGQTMWMNQEWLNALSLPVPKTIEELEMVLTAFRDQDPNGNGVQDEIPLLGSTENYQYNPVEFILNAYVPNDPYYARFYVDGEEERYAPFQVAYREGLLYLRTLYLDGLLDRRCFKYSKRQLQELVNSDCNLVGAFTTDSIADVLYQGNPEIMAKYIHVLPLKGPEGEQHAIRKVDLASVGAIIPKKAKNKDGAKRIMEQMMSVEGSLIARFGEQGVDWEYSDGREVSLFGEASTIVTKNYLSDISQNKHLQGIGPMQVPETFQRGVTWNGVNSDTECIDARAEMSYAAFLSCKVPKRRPDKKLCHYVDSITYAFIQGKYDVQNDEVWNTFQKKARHMIGE